MLNKVLKNHFNICFFYKKMIIYNDYYNNNSFVFAISIYFFACLIMDSCFHGGSKISPILSYEIIVLSSSESM